jgi:cell shape-determining protein MreC
MEPTMDPVRYREFADFCEQLARLDDLKQHRSALREMAQAWRKLADEEERG